MNLSPSTDVSRIIGVDPGTQITGYGVILVRGACYETVDYGCIRPPKQLKLSDRYLILFDALEELINKYQPHTLVVETQYVNKNPQSAIKLGMARGMALIAAKRKGIPVYEYAPSKAKLAVTGNGAASKLQVQGMVKMLLNLAHLPQPEDAADALALAICHAHSIHSSMLFGSEI
jgi:crossover junction endodeoxyribonuclease RuvC